ncbi:MAG: hypothetical protein ACOZNI_32715 [Myxococcota bacterium]
MSAEPALQQTPAQPVAPTPWAAVALAVLGPVLVLGATLAWLARPDPEAAKSPLVQAQEKAVAHDPDVLLLGASKVGTDLDQDALAKALGPARDELRPLNLSGTTAPVWYAILENRVYATGKKPRLIVVYSTFDWVLATRPTGEAERAMLLAQMGADEPVLRAKSLGEGVGGATWDRVRRHRTELHTAMMGFVRDAAVGLAFAPPDAQSVVDAGAKVAAPALESLFGAQAGLDLSHVPRAIPIVEQERETAKAATRVEDTLLPDFLALAKENGARIVFVHAPVRLAQEGAFAVDPQLLRDAVQMINEAGAGYVDLRELRLGDAAFGDATHLNRVGRDALTKALIARLQEIGATGDGPIAPAKLPVVTKPPKVARTGSPPALPEVKPTRGPRACGYEAPIPELRPINDFWLQTAGFGMVSPLVMLEDGAPMKAHAGREEFDEACKGAFLHQERAVKFSPTGATPDDLAKHTYAFALADEAPLRTAAGGEAWWVYPGTTLALEFEEPFAGAFGVAIDAVVYGEPKADPVVRLGDVEAPMRGVGLHRSASLTAPAPGGPWSLTVSSPADGGWVLIRRLVYGNAADARFVVGSPGGTSVNVIATDGVYAAPPAPLAPLGPAVDEAGIARWEIAGVPDTKELWSVASVAGCSPVRVLEDGKPLATPVVRVEDVKDAGKYTQVGTSLFARASDGGSPASNGRAYGAVLDETRRCRGLRWLYPGDALTLTVKPTFIASLLADPTEVEVGGAAVGAGEAEATLRVRVGDELFLEATFPVTALNSSPPRLPLARPLPRGPEPVTIELSTPPESPWVLVGSLALTEPGAIALPEGSP